MLFHVSEEPGIERFEPRPSPYAPHPVVWAVEAARLCNYLVPRECPRVTYYATPESRAHDIAKFDAAGGPSVVIEAGWRERVAKACVYLYAMEPDAFECIDANAGYFVSRVAVTPVSIAAIADLPAAIAAQGARLLVEPSLWRLHDAVRVSSLGFSMIRMRNAKPRPR